MSYGAKQDVQWNKKGLFFCCCFQSAIASEWRTKWAVDALLCEFTWEINFEKKKQTYKKKNMGTQKVTESYTDRPFLHVMLCFCFFSFGERELCWTLNSDSARNPWALQSLFLCFDFFLKKHFRLRAKERTCVGLFEHSLGLPRAINIHSQWIRMGWSSELCRALILSPLLTCTYNVKVWSDFFLFCFWLNSIFYRFCRHFVVGRKK